MALLTPFTSKAFSILVLHISQVPETLNETNALLGGFENAIAATAAKAIIVFMIVFFISLLIR
jgi:hypothetical protein